MQFNRYSQALVGFALLYGPLILLKAVEPVPINQGLSPNGKVVIVVKADEDTSQDTVSAGNEHPYLENVATGKIIGPLEEVDTDGGGYGRVLENVTVYWSPDSRFVAVRYRAGRLSEAVIIYLIEPHGQGYRAVPQKLPDVNSGPNGQKVFAHVSHGANMGDMFDRWISSTEIAVIKYRFFPPDPPMSATDFFDDDGRIEVVYSNQAGHWIVSSYKRPPDP